MEWDPVRAIISKGPRNFSESFLDGQVERKNLALTKACCPTLKGGAEVRRRLAGPW